MTEEDPHADQPVEPLPVDPEPDLTEAAPVSRWPWVATVAIAFLAFFAILTFIGLGWHFVVTRDERRETQDYGQLLALMERVQTLALLVIGAILGVGGVKATTAATSASERNKSEARIQHDKARQNRERAAHNARVARNKDEQVRSAVPVLRELVRVADLRKVDATVHVSDGLRFARIQGTSALRIPETATAAIDPDLDELAQRARHLLDDLQA